MIRFPQNATCQTVRSLNALRHFNADPCAKIDEQQIQFSSKSQSVAKEEIDYAEFNMLLTASEIQSYQNSEHVWHQITQGLQSSENGMNALFGRAKQHLKIKLFAKPKNGLAGTLRNLLTGTIYIAIGAPEYTNEDRSRWMNVFSHELVHGLHLSNAQTRFSYLALRAKRAYSRINEILNQKVYYKTYTDKEVKNFLQQEVRYLLSWEKKHLIRELLSEYVAYTLMTQQVQTLDKYDKEMIQANRKLAVEYRKCLMWFVAAKCA